MSCAYGVCGSACLESSNSICCTGSSSSNSSGAVQCGNNWFCSLTAGYCCPKQDQEYCVGAALCFDAIAGQTCCGPTWCPQNQTCASSGDRCCPKSQTACATDWWLIPVSTSVTVISITSAPTTTPTSATSSLNSSDITTTSTEIPKAQPSTSSGLSTGAKAGIAMGAILGVAALISLILLLLRRRRRTPVPSPNPIYVPTEASLPESVMSSQDRRTWGSSPPDWAEHREEVSPLTEGQHVQQQSPVSPEQQPLYAPYRPPVYPSIPRD